MSDFLLGYIIGSSTNNECENMSHDSKNNNTVVNSDIFMIILLFVILLLLYFPLIAILGYEVGESIYDTNLVKWTFSIFFLFIFYKHLDIYANFFKPILSKISNNLLYWFALISIVFFISNILMFILLNVNIFQDNNILILLHTKYSLLLNNISNFLFR